MPKRLDLVGQTFGLLTVQSFAYYSREKKKAYWNCICKCGKQTVVSTLCLRHGDTKSCGCYGDLVRKKFGGHHITHSYSHHPICNTYYNMKGRCCNKNDDAYKNYGGRGIKVCDEWLNNSSAFVEWSLSNGWKEGLTLDRIDVNGNYEPNNCRWITRKEQMNNKRNSRFISYNGTSKTISQWAELFGIKYHVLIDRINKGWSVEEALTTPVKSRKTKEV